MFTLVLITTMWFIVSMVYIDSKLKESDYRNAFVALVGLLLVCLSLVLVKFL
jgi:hypothetical protein